MQSDFVKRPDGGIFLGLALQKPQIANTNMYYKYAKGK